MLNSSFFRYLWIAAFAAMTSSLFAEDLLSVYEKAKQADTTYLASFESHAGNQELKKEARAGLLPSISLNGSALHQNSELDYEVLNAEFDSSEKDYSYGVTAVQPLYNRTNWIHYQQAKQTEERSELELAQQEQDLIWRVTEAYFSAVKAQQIADVMAYRLDQLSRTKQTAHRLYDAGRISQQPLIQIDAIFNRNKAESLAAATEIQSNLAKLAVITGKTITAVSALDADKVLTLTLDKTFSEYQQLAEDKNLTLTMAKDNLNLATLNIKAAKSNYYPKVNLVADYQEVETPGRFAVDGNYRRVGVEFNMPLYAGGFVSANTKRAIHDSNIAQENHTQVVRQISQQVESAYYQLQNLQQSYNAAKAAAKAAKQAYQMETEKYQAGRSTVLDVSDALDTLYINQVLYAETATDYAMGFIFLHYITGLVTVEQLKKINALVCN